MKKRLFISSILMTLVLLVAITTATFAWYSATAAGTSASASSVNNAQLTTSVNGTVASLEAQPIEFTVVMDGNLDLSNNDGQTFYTQNGAVLPAANAVNLKAFTLTASFGSGADAQVKTAMVGKVYKFKVEGAAYTAPVEDDDDTPEVDETVAGNLQTVLFPTTATSSANVVEEAQNYVASIDIWVYVQATDNLIILIEEPADLAALEGATTATVVGKIAVRAHSTNGTPEANLPGKIVVSTPSGYGTELALD